MRGLLTAAVDWAAENGAHIIEAYPKALPQGASASAAYTGVVQVFVEAGFVEMARRAERQPIMRKSL